VIAALFDHVLRKHPSEEQGAGLRIRVVPMSTEADVLAALEAEFAPLGGSRSLEVAA
jgi:hypothetical protein